MKLKYLPACLLCLPLACFACRLPALLAICRIFLKLFWKFFENFLGKFWKKNFSKKFFFKKNLKKFWKFFFIFIVLIFKIRAQFIKVQKWPKKFFLVKNIKMMDMIPTSAVEGCISIPSFQMEIPPSVWWFYTLLFR